ncbi:MAG: mechanosensitive ion channel [Xanthomonadales bacterium]|nr:mechanosensitive ion channel [Xanthomonadales bacterium]
MTSIATRRPGWIGAVMLLVGLLASAPPSAADVPPSLATAIEAARAALGGTELDEAQRRSAAELLDAAAGFDRDAETLLEQAAQVRATATGAAAAPVLLSPAERERSLAEWTARLPPRADIDTLERLLAQERAVVADLQSRIEGVAGELAAVLARPGLAADLVVLRRRIDETAPGATGETVESSALAEARRLRRAAEHRRVRAELALRQAEQDTAAGRQRDLEASLQSLRQELALRTPRLALLSRRIVELGRVELEELAQAHAEQAVALEQTGGAAAALASENATLAGELVDTNERLARERATLTSLQQARDRVAAALRDSQTRLELGGTSEVVGRWLWRERRALEPPRTLQRRLGELRDRVGELRLRLLVLAEQRRELADVDAALAAVREAHPEAGEDDTVEGIGDDEPLRALLAARLELAERLEPLLRRRIEVLGDSEAALLAQIERSRTLQQALDRHLLWIRSHGPVDGAWLGRIGAGLADLVRPSRFATTGRLLIADATSRPLRWLAALAVLAAVFVARRQARQRLPGLAQAVRMVREDRFAHTLVALAWTFVAASAWALAAALSGWLLQGIGSAGRYSDSLGRALVAVALPVLTLSLLRWLVRERGIAEAHLRWSKARLAVLRRWLPTAQALLLPAWFVIALAFMRNQELAIDVQARLALVLMALTGAALLWRLLAPGAVWTPRAMAVEPSTLRRLSRVVLPALLLASAGLALGGYLYTAALLMRAQFASIGVVLAVALLHGLLARWFLLGERRLALRRMEARREAEAADGVGDGESGDAVADAEQDLTLEAVNAQSRRLLRALKLALLVLGLAWTWSDLLPAIARLDQIALWYFNETGADGAPVRQAVTLMALLLGAGVLVLTMVAARNLPGLVEIGLQARPGIDAASRYAITSVTRYAVVIAGVLVGLGLLGMRWSQLQWMAAALTVGLGFGLQEIFANFVSGLILLFERPFRVGDVITVGELSGTVTRIRTRATTIVDFDNKEIVIPNKAFITDRLINWTLSDSTTRVTVKVGVAYGSPADKVHALLMQAAREHPRVLAEPAPRTWFMAFGASSLDFELRVFVATLGDRLVVTNELNGRIAALFQENGIEIAFPQLDLHIRDLPAVTPPVAGADRADRDRPPPGAT